MGQQASKALAGKLAGGAPLEGEPGAGAGEQEEEGHAPRGQERHKENGRGRAGLRVHDVPVPSGEGFGGVEQKDHEHRQHA
jgi:hypothetical protein